MLNVPTITLEGDANGAPHPEPAAYRNKFSGKYSKGGIGHNLPQEPRKARRYSAPNNRVCQLRFLHRSR